MKSSCARKRTASGAPGVKLLLTASALAATLGGWAVLAAGQSQAVVSAQPPVLATASPAQVHTGPAPQIQPTMRVVSVPPDAVGPQAPIAVSQSSR
jgi:hypothetical protein